MLKTADTEGSLLGRDEVSSTTHSTIWQCGSYPSEWYYVGWVAFAGADRAVTMPLLSSLCNHEPSLKEALCCVGRQVF